MRILENNVTIFKATNLRRSSCEVCHNNPYEGYSI
jgi:hypothetical protein